MEYMDAVSERRSEYMLSGDIEQDENEIIGMIGKVSSEVPSAYNCQSARAFMLFGDDHRRLWRIVADSLIAKIGEERFESTRPKIEGFSNAAGTILFYEVDAVTQGLIEKYPSYAKHFPNWAEQGNGILQFAIWTGLRDMGLGANVQHYNPLIDDEVARVFGIPEGYRLIAQMPFGRIVRSAPKKPRLPSDETVVRAHARV